jgi:uncharacterized protein (TIGR01244 family)
MQLRRLLPVICLLATLVGSQPTTLLGAPQAAAESPAATSVSAADLLLNGRRPFPGILTGGQPTLEQFEAISELGYTTVINLRSAAEMTAEIAGREDVEALGMNYVFIPVASPADLNRENVQLLADALAAADGPTVVHCASGNRIGAIFALKAIYLDDVPAEEALEIGRSAGLTSLEPVILQKLGLE